ncbi:hypothetical protein [Biformimicrobium ophioploci]|uniref:hypothetical protein n=1 Tax=Biformimicrobium ophioploci TaxID=3036711 RepID=UPI002554BD54|nr:hypothetical protein [Microbulbifer sp. NKW57]
MLTNQNKLFLSKQDEWIDGYERAKLFRTEHKDIAINQMFEANTRDVDQRIQLLQCELDQKGLPRIPEDALGPRQIAAEVAEEVAAAEEVAEQKAAGEVPAADLLETVETVEAVETVPAMEAAALATDQA